MAQTSILGRMSQLVRANINALLDGAEDPEKMLDQMIRDFTNNIAEAEEAVAQTVGNLRLLEDDVREARDAASEWQSKARAASDRAEGLRAQDASEADRFDQLARTNVLDPLGIEGGFAWSGVPPERREDRLPAFRRTFRGFVPQIDAQVASDGLSGPDGIVPELGVPGENPGPLSPQGGLRLSLSGALRLAESLAARPVRRLWTPSHGPGDYGNGFLESTGPGLLVFDNPVFYPRPLVGHFADAYGILAGAWHDRLRGASFAYILNGLPEGDEDDGWRPEELAIFDAVAQALA